MKMAPITATTPPMYPTHPFSLQSQAWRALRGIRETALAAVACISIIAVRPIMKIVINQSIGNTIDSRGLILPEVENPTIIVMSMMFIPKKATGRCQPAGSLSPMHPKPLGHGY